MMHARSRQLPVCQTAAESAKLRSSGADLAWPSLYLAASCSEIAVGCSPVLSSLKLVGPIQSDRWWARRLRKLHPGASQLC